MKKHKPSFKEILREVPPPKRLMLQTPLPHVFDLYWDIKDGAGLCSRYRDDLPEEVRVILVQHGFDASPKAIAQLQEEWKAVHEPPEPTVVDWEEQAQLQDEEQSLQAAKAKELAIPKSLPSVEVGLDLI